MNLPGESPALHLHGLLDLPLADRLQRVLTNLERCPAWQQSGPSAMVHLYAPCERLCPQSELSLVAQALSAAVSKRLHFCLSASHLVVDAAAAQDLGNAAGSRLTQLSLNNCQLHPSFWAAMWAHLPNLQRLWLGTGAVAETPAASLVSYFMNPARPLQLRLSSKWCTEVGGAGQVQQLLQAAGVALVTAVAADRVVP
jgi:hypothetical protein